jgi:hypothetical protein
MPERTSSELIVDSLMAALTTVRSIEGTGPTTVPHEFGNLKDAEHGATPRIVWIHQGGVAVERLGSSAAEGEPRPLGLRIARYVARLRFKEKTDCELALDQLIRAARTLPNADRVDFTGQPYSFGTQTEGRHTEGSQLLDATVLVRVPIPADPVGSTREVEVQGSELRAGIENPIGEDPDDEDAEYDVDRWAG